MNSSFAYDAYYSHDLNISMRTSSGDEIRFDFKNQQTESYAGTKDTNSSSSMMKFSSMQSFHFSIDTNGIDEQDKKEIDEFMKIAQPYIENFLTELDQGEQKSPISKIARDISDIFAPMKEKNQQTKDFVKSNIVDAFDNTLQSLKIDKTDSLEKIIEDAKKLLEKTLMEFDKLNQFLYA